jgi:hypothetical protein
MSKNARILILDTYYPDFIKSFPMTGGTYQEELTRLLSFMFGTGDSYSYWLKEHGWDTCDVIGNHEALQQLWHNEQGNILDHGDGKRVALEQIKKFDPDVLFLQDLSFFDANTLKFIREEYHVNLIAAQCSCPMPSERNIQACDVIFTSFPHYVEEFNKLGVKGVFSRLAFDPRVRDKLTIDFIQHKKIPVSFIGGVGYPSHWKAGLEVLETLSKRLEEFRWFGYGVETLPNGMALKDRYCHQAWGMDMYNIVARSNIVLNRHGEVSKQYANNMKLFETTGCGAMLLTDHKSNLAEMFEVGKECVSYSDADHAADLARFFVEHPKEAEEIAVRGLKRTLQDHTYTKKMGHISFILREML